MPRPRAASAIARRIASSSVTIAATSLSRGRITRDRQREKRQESDTEGTLRAPRPDAALTEGTPVRFRALSPIRTV
ncbi:hypothetical protein GCM10023107_13010 [Actinoplanes octamycinicus]|nr:hypothetical protein Aoc01nite_16950 [Actinoplanes octamycinicus]